MNRARGVDSVECVNLGVSVEVWFGVGNLGFWSIPRDGSRRGPGV